MSTKLPAPMCHIKRTIVGEYLLIVGYSTATGHTATGCINRSCQLPAASIISLSLSSDQVASLAGAVTNRYQSI